jgi:hypothetical protein
MDEKPLFSEKPHLINAIIPLFLKNITKNILIFTAVLLIWIMVKKLNVVSSPYWLIVVFVLIAASAYAFILSSWKLIILYFTRYHFYSSYLLSEFKFFRIKRHIVPYNRITDLIIDMSLWDRICGAGDIGIKTADDSSPDLVLYYLPKPEEIQRKILGYIKPKKPFP